MTEPNPAFSDLLSLDDLRRLSALYLTFSSTSLDLRGVALALGGLTSKYPGAGLEKDVRALLNILDESLRRNDECSCAIWSEFRRIAAERSPTEQELTARAIEKTFH